uniref:Uncharacterized protein n=1 Tax=Phenylobacterium glaciei TaxID=2803784 RepID=A0A974P5V2_9CAUL|nr:hypothetical protein JKL49_06760 [Phenylobacterium glaciei]
MNAPVGDTFAVRFNIDYLNDQGFIDQPFLVNEVGVSDPDPDFKNPTAVRANLHRKTDVNTEETLSAGSASAGSPPTPST